MLDVALLTKSYKVSRNVKRGYIYQYHNYITFYEARNNKVRGPIKLVL